MTGNVCLIAITQPQIIMNDLARGSEWSFTHSQSPAHTFFFFFFKWTRPPTHGQSTCCSTALWMTHEISVSVTWKYAASCQKTGGGSAVQTFGRPEGPFHEQCVMNSTNNGSVALSDPGSRSPVSIINFINYSVRRLHICIQAYL